MPAPKCVYSQEAADHLVDGMPLAAAPLAPSPIRGGGEATKIFDLITPAEAASLLGITYKQLSRERAAGTGCQYLKLGRVFYRRADIAALIAQKSASDRSAPEPPSPAVCSTSTDPSKS
jgi:hypothetical protein